MSTNAREPKLSKIVQSSRFGIKLRISISTLFLGLILPAFSAFVAYIYSTNREIYKDNAAALIINHNNQMADKLLALLDPIGDSLLAMALQVRDEPSYFNGSGFNQTLLLHLENNPNLVSIFLASDQGSFHQAQRMREGMIVAGRVPVANAKFNFWTVEPTSANPGDSIFTFFAASDAAPIDQFTVNNFYDPRNRPFYKSLLATLERTPENKRQGLRLLDEPYVAGSTGQATMTVSTPVYVNGAFKGMLGESFELSKIAEFLKRIQISKNTQTYIIDSAGYVVVSTEPDNGYTIEKTTLNKRNVNDVRNAGTPVHQAFLHHVQTQSRQFEFTDPKSEEVFLAQFTNFPNEYNKKWQMVTLAPVSDFLVGLNSINQRLIVYGGLACFLLVFLTYILSRAISKPIESLTDNIRNLLEFDRTTASIRSNIVEINILGDAVNKLRTTLRAFTSYVPRDLVNDLLRSGNAIELGGESRYLTIMFTDLKDFSTISEVTPSRALLKCVSEYLALVTYAVKEEAGTVDKFIGDSVMAFWGAPLLNQSHAFHACVTAVKSQRRMVKLNEQLLVEGLPTLTVRIGIHSDAVLVGNIGSAERMSYTVMGDGVNIAARLEGINKEFATAICISHATYKEAGERLWTRPIDVITVKGRKGEIPIYELVAIRSEDPETSASQRDLDLCALTREAFQLYTEGNYSAASSAYSKIIETFDDGLSKIMRDKCVARMSTEEQPTLKTVEPI